MSILLKSKKRRLLAWDSSSKSGVVIALEWSLGSKSGWAGVKKVGELALNVDAAHSEKLLWGVDQVLTAANWRPDEVDVFAVGIGPGSFTGLRIGMTTARTLAHTLKKPLIGVSSLAALARPVAVQLIEYKGDDQKLLRPWVIASTDACKGELFALWGNARTVRDCVVLASGDRSGLWKRGAEEQVLSPGSLIQHMRRKLSNSKIATGWCVVGEGRHRYTDVWDQLPQGKRIESAGIEFDQVQADALGQLAWEADQAGLAGDPLQLLPRYLRASDAEIKLKAGLLQPGPTRGN